MEITQDCPKPARTISPAQLAANQANALLSTGPVTDQGKANSSLNAVKCGLTGCTVLLPSEDAAQYERHIHDYENELRPVGPRERALVQSLADTDWRLNRIPSLEASFYALGQVQLANSFQDFDPALRPGIIQLETYLTYEKQLRNLHLQESRLHRRRAKDAAELRQLQQARKAEAEKQAANRPKQESEAKVAAAAANPNGFEFSNTATSIHLATPESEIEPVLVSWRPAAPTYAHTAEPDRRDLETTIP